jgi:hypothetical protein
MLFVFCLFFTFDYLETQAQENITILDHTIKPLETVSSGRFIKTVWEVQLCNSSESPINCVITILFIDKNEKPIEEAKKTIEINANETRTYSDTVLLRATLAKQVVSTLVSLGGE